MKQQKVWGKGVWQVVAALSGGLEKKQVKLADEKQSLAAVCL